MTARDLFTNAAPQVPGNGAKAEEGQADRHRIVNTPAGAALSVASRACCCGTCGAGSKAPHGFVRCEHLPVWVWHAPRIVCTFAPSRWVELTPAVRAKRDAQAGIDQAVAAAERQVAGWLDTAYAFIELWCSQNNGARCIGHDIVQASVAKGVIQPANSKAWGGPIQRAARMGLIKRIGFDEDPNRHGNPVPLWEVI